MIASTTRSRRQLAPLSTAIAFIILATSFAVFLPSTADGSEGNPSSASLLLAQVGARAHTLTDLELPDDRPEAFSVRIERDGVSHVLELRRHSLRAAGFIVRVQRPGGAYERIEPAPSATYRGFVAGVPEARVVASLGRHGLTADIFTNDARDWSVRPAPEPLNRRADSRHAVFADEDAIREPVDCPLDEVVETGTPPPPAAGTATAPPSGGQHLSQIAFDVDYQYYLLKNSSVQECVDTVEAIMNDVDYFYARDIMVTYEIPEILVRTSQVYFPTDGGHLLELFRDEWNTNQTHVVRDHAHLMTNKDNIQYGGLAYVNVVCTDFAYGWSLDSTNIVGHELGHNWAAGHCHDTSPCNNMCGGCLYIAPTTKDIMVTHRDSRTCLDDVGVYPSPLPPYAHPEGLALARQELAVLDPTPFDVLGNDHDGNLDPLSIDDHSSASERGGAITLSPGTGPDGRDEIVYEAPGYVFAGEDRFTYTVGDGTGLQTTGEVTIDSLSHGLAGYWGLDDATGPTAGDLSNHGRHGTLEGGGHWAGGPFGGALHFDGIDDAVAIPALDLHADAITVSAWVRRSGHQYPFAPLLFCRDGDTVAGINFGMTDELRYHWNNDGSTFNWNSGLVVPDSEWVFVALVVEPVKATIYLFDGVTMQSAVNPVAHGIEEFNGVLKLGHDTSHPSRFFKGMLDEARVYDHALEPEQIEDLALRGGPAVAPNPLDGGGIVPELAELSWQPGLLAETHDVYLGEDFAAVVDATPTSPEYAGSVSQPTMVVDAPPDPGIVRYWRVDEVNGPTVVKGDVWLYQRVESAGRWALDETQGSTAIDSEGDRHGTFGGGVLLDQPGAHPTSGASATFDGVDDHVEIPPLDLEGGEATIMGWARLDGIQASWAGLVFTRAGSSVAGVSTLVTGHLRYHWDGAFYDWESGLVLPIGKWAFFALVVRPDRATLYVGEDGDLTSSTNWTGHPAEAFDGVLYLGQDPTGGRFFKGGLDEVRVYRSALTERDVARIYARALLAGPASGPFPADEAESVSLDADLQWDAGPGADSHRLHFGTIDPPPFAADLVETIFDPGPLAEDTTYFWRVDEVNSHGTTTGDSWRFTTLSAAAPAGAVPNGADVPGSPLVLERTPSGDVLLTWEPSCVANDIDFAVYEGTLGEFDSHTPRSCGTGSPPATITPDPGNRYFLVVPLSSNREGSYGVDGDGQPRPQSTEACLSRDFGGCD